MSVKAKAVKGSFLLMLGEGVTYGCSFVRNMILARMLAKADFGIAATFSLIMTLLEFSAKLGINQFVVRDKDADDPDFIGTAHMVLFTVASTSCIAIAVGSGPLSQFFGIPGQRWAIMLLGLVPFLRGLEHLDVRRFERSLRFAPSLTVEAIPQVVIMLAAWPVARWLHDYRTVLVLLLTKSIASCVGSHVLAERPYRWKLQRRYFRRMLHFGWPLLINGFLMFGVFQGDQFLIAASYTMTDLAPYAAASALTMAPWFIFGRIFSSVMLPVLARVQEDPAAFAKRYRQVLAVVTVFAMSIGLTMVLGGEALMRIVYGPKYAGAGILLGFLASANAFRSLRTAPSLAALAKGDSQNQMISNMGRVVSLLPAAVLARMHQPLWMVACTGLVGEALALWFSISRLKRRDGIPLSISILPAGRTLFAITAAGALAFLGVHRLPPVLGLSVAMLGTCLGAAVLTSTMPELRTEAATLYSLRRRTPWEWFNGTDAKHPTRIAT